MSVREGNLPMADFVVMEVTKCIESLTHDQRGLRLCEVLTLGNEKEELATFTKPRAEDIRNIQLTR
jgi:hypothetical protein